MRYVEAEYTKGLVKTFPKWMVFNKKRAMSIIDNALLLKYLNLDTGNLTAQDTKVKRLLVLVTDVLNAVEILFGLIPRWDATRLQKSS